MFRRAHGWLEERVAFQLVRATLRQYARDKAVRLGAALAFFAMFSLAPLLVITIGLASLVSGDAAARAQIVETIGSLVGPEGAEAIGVMLDRARGPDGQGGLRATVFGSLALALGATGVFVQLRDALNTVWGVRRVGGGVKRFFADRVFTFGVVLAVGFLLLVSLVVTAALAAVGARLEAMLPLGAQVWLVLNFVVSVLVTAFLFAALFKLLPDVRLAWRDVAVGALATALLFIVGQLAIGYYLGASSTASAYGAAGSLVIVLLWLFYSAQIFLLGAEFVQVYADRYGSKVRPEEDAVRLPRQGA